MKWNLELRMTSGIEMFVVCRNAPNAEEAKKDAFRRFGGQLESVLSVEELSKETK